VMLSSVHIFIFFFQAEDGIRDFHVTGVQTCALPICLPWWGVSPLREAPRFSAMGRPLRPGRLSWCSGGHGNVPGRGPEASAAEEIGRASCRERGERSGGGGGLRRKRGVCVRSGRSMV